ncbi:MAG TPA: NAD-dependent epimerase/dehydratase family protein [Nitrospinaceae bacterium]|nr:NAD-dependent epimerase/dehydratase family protein [Nitrospinaceae bacterium]
MSKKILITGGLGFLGAHCIQKWKELDYEIHVIDNLSTNAVNTDHPLTEGVHQHICDILDVRWDQWGETKFDLILHLASPVGPVGVLKHSGKMGRIILDDIYWAIEGAKLNKCPLLFVSTSEIYGYRESKTYLQEDSDKVLKGDFTVRNEYAIAKLLSEIVLSNQAKNDPDFKYQIIRPFNITGEFQLPDAGFVLPRFVTQALKGEDITVYYDGSQIRAFTWVKDIVEGIYLTSTVEENLWNEEWNLGNAANEETILYLAEKVKEMTNTSSKIVNVEPTDLHGPLFSEAPEKIPDSTKIETLLNWKPTKGVDEVIKEVVDFYQHKNK